MEHASLVGSLTKVQHQTLMFLRDYIEKHGYSPTIAEIKDHLGLRSRAPAHRFVVILEERGLIQRSDKRARGIDITERGMQVRRGTDAAE